MNKAINFINNHHLGKRVYEMLVYFDIINFKKKPKHFQKLFKQKLLNVNFVETLAHFLEIKLKNTNNIELKMNLKELIYDLNYLKQYLN